MQTELSVEEVLQNRTLKVGFYKMSFAPCAPFHAQNEVLMSVNTFNPLSYHPWIKGLSHENKGNDQQPKKLLMVLQILPVRT